MVEILGITMKKHNCEKWIEEGRGCSVCNSLHLDIEKAKELQTYVNWQISTLAQEVNRLNMLLARENAKKTSI